MEDKTRKSNEERVQPVAQPSEARCESGNDDGKNPVQSTQPRPRALSDDSDPEKAFPKTKITITAPTPVAGQPAKPIGSSSKNTGTSSSEGDGSATGNPESSTTTLDKIEGTIV